MKQTIMVVDDSGLNLRVAMNMLKDHFDVMCANSGQAAFDLLEKRIPDLILLDVHMPKMSGFEVMDKLHENEMWKDIPV